MRTGLFTPLDTYWAWSLYDSLIVVMPTLDIVVARAGQSSKRNQGAGHYEVLKPFLLPIAAATSAMPATKSNPAQSAAPYPPSPMKGSVLIIDSAEKPPVLEKWRK